MIDLAYFQVDILHHDIIFTFINDGGFHWTLLVTNMK